jgi:hypothetical protein
MHVVLKVVEMIFVPQKTVYVLGLDWIPIVQSMTEELELLFTDSKHLWRLPVPYPRNITALSFSVKFCNLVCTSDISGLHLEMYRRF